MKIKVAEATGKQLDYLVTAALYGDRITGGLKWHMHFGVPFPAYSTDPAEGWPVVEKEIDTLSRRDGYFYAHRFKRHVGRVDRNFRSYPDEPERFAYGPTTLIAGLRCLVMAKLGEEVEVPEELP